MEALFIRDLWQYIYFYQEQSKNAIPGFKLDLR